MFGWRIGRGGRLRGRCIFLVVGKYYLIHLFHPIGIEHQKIRHPNPKIRKIPPPILKLARNILPNNHIPPKIQFFVQTGLHKMGHRLEIIESVDGF